MDGTPSRFIVPVSGSILTSEVSGTCFTQTAMFISQIPRYFLFREKESNQRKTGFYYTGFLFGTFSFS
jgi:hypothetical protein